MNGYEPGAQSDADLGGRRRFRSGSVVVAEVPTARHFRDGQSVCGARLQGEKDMPRVSWSMACFGSGSLLGFLFGMPRVLQSASAVSAA